MTGSLRLFYLYRIASRFYFHLPILFVFFFVHGLPVIQVELLLAAYGLAIMLTARLGVGPLAALPRRHVLALGEVLKAAGLVVMVVDPSLFWALLAAQLVGGAGFSLGISNDGALLRKLTAGGAGDLFGRVQSNTQSYMFIATMVSGITGAVLFSRWQAAPFLASVGANLVALAAVIPMREAPADRPAAQLAGGAGRPPIQAREWLWMHFYIVGRGIPLAVFVGFLPYLFFVREHVSLALFGVVLSLFSLAAFVSARYAGRLLARTGTAWVLTGSLLVMAASVALFAYTAVAVSLVAITLLGLGAGCVRPVTMRLLSETAGASLNRLASIMEQRYGAANAAVLVAGGGVLTLLGLPALMLALAGLLVALWAVLLLAGRAISSRPAEAPVLTGE